MLGLDALPGEVVQVGHHATDLLSRGHLAVAFHKEPENRDSRWQLLLMSYLNRQKSSEAQARKSMCKKWGREQKHDTSFVLIQTLLLITLSPNSLLTSQIKDSSTPI